MSIPIEVELNKEDLLAVLSRKKDQLAMLHEIQQAEWEGHYQQWLRRVQAALEQETLSIKEGDDLTEDVFNATNAGEMFETRHVVVPVDPPYLPLNKALATKERLKQLHKLITHVQLTAGQTYATESWRVEEWM